MWTHFWDMHSGGSTKEKPYQHIFIQAPKDEASLVFYNRFGHNPYRVTCTCCGRDYSVSEYKTLKEATEYHRSGKYGWPKLSLKGYCKREDVLVIHSKDIKANEKIGDLPQEGYVWMG